MCEQQAPCWEQPLLCVTCGRQGTYDNLYPWLGRLYCATHREAAQAATTAMLFGDGTPAATDPAPNYARDWNRGAQGD